MALPTLERFSFSRDFLSGFERAYGDRSGYVPFFSNNSAGLGSSNPVYSVYASGYTAYATPTDLISLSGSATKTVIPIFFGLLLNSTSATLTTIDWIRRTTANTGGTPTAQTAVKWDSSSATPTAVLNSYGAAPTLGDSAGTLSTTIANTAVLTAAPASFQLGSIFGNAGLTSYQSPVILNGAAESLCANFKGAALPAGFTATIAVMWIEV